MVIARTTKLEEIISYFLKNVDNRFIEAQPFALPDNIIIKTFLDKLDAWTFPSQPNILHSITHKQAGKITRDSICKCDLT